MSQVRIIRPSEADKIMKNLYGDLSRRLEGSPTGNCPVEMTSAFLKLCLAQSCGKCVPCRVGLDKLSAIYDRILDGNGQMGDLDLIEETARSIADSADCAIGFEGAKLVLDGFLAFREDYEAHIRKNMCAARVSEIPCMAACPTHVDIPGYISCVQAGKYDDAIRIIRRQNPFPSVCGLVCEHPCENYCRRQLVDDAVNIRGLKRVAVEKAGVVAPPECVASTGKKVAVIGGGPSGLTAAYYLSLLGHKVKVFDQRDRLGGMLRYGIPPYRLPNEWLDKDINAILSTGVEFETGVSVGKDIRLEDIRKEYDSIYIGIGAQAASSLGIEGEDADGVMSAVEILRMIGDGERPDFSGKNVVVVGGGNVAMDATRTSLRLGAESVVCAYRRRIQDMTAQAEEIEGAMAEGAEIMSLMAPVKIEVDENNHVKSMLLQKQVTGPVDRGRPSVRNADEDVTVIPADIVIVAIGQSIDSDAMAQVGIPTRRNRIVANLAAEVTDMEGVFAGGDCVFGPETVIRAIEAGKVAAVTIDEYLGGNGRVAMPAERVAASYKFTPACGRVNMTERIASERKEDFDLMEYCMSDEETAQECSRCLRCDHFGLGKRKEAGL
ncbi:MAG: FAD-dependent oxidoreductase [Mogibacterium sp.]|nr:FAD-dependent oxidoreductase [Mogibacterium sp.]